MSIRLLGAPGLPGEILAFVHLPSETEEVRVRRLRHGGWRCDTCGPQQAAWCPHAGSALAAWRRTQTPGQEAG